jgi:hypothetical protein
MIVEPVALLVIALGAYRLAHVVVGTDDLIEGTHRRIIAWAYEVDDCGDEVTDDCGKAVRRRGVGLARQKVVDLLDCPHCAGMWIGLGMLCAWAERWPWELGFKGWITAVGIAGLQSFLTSIDGR